MDKSILQTHALFYFKLYFEFYHFKYSVSSQGLAHQGMKAKCVVLPLESCPG